MMLKSHNKDDVLALRKQLIQMRLELNRQKIKHEGLALIEPIEKLRSYKKRLSEGSTPLLIVAGVTLASFFMTRYRRSANGLLPIARLATGLLPLFMSAADSSVSATKNNNLNRKY